MRAWTSLLLYGVAACTQPAAAQVDQQTAQEYFKEAQTLCQRDSGHLWGMSVCAPMVIADRWTQTFATSQPPPDAPRPEEVGLVNAPVNWGGSTWIAYTWDPDHADPGRQRRQLRPHLRLCIRTGIRPAPR